MPIQINRNTNAGTSTMWVVDRRDMRQHGDGAGALSQE